MRNEKIAEAYDSIQPSREAKSRVLNNVLNRAYSGEIKKRRMFNAKILAPIAACALIVLAVVIPTFIQNGGNQLPYSGLVFNLATEWQVVDANGGDNVWGGPNNNVSSWPSVSVELRTLTDEEMRSVFPALYSTFTATASYLPDGSIVEVFAVEDYKWTQIRVAESAVAHTQTMVHESELQVSHMHGVEVIASMLGNDEDIYRHFQIDFMLGNIAYNIRLFHPMEAGKELLAELVNRIILGGAADLSVLAN